MLEEFAKGDINMATVLFVRNGSLTVGSVENEQDLLPGKRIALINGPPDDRRCDCCGRHISELKPFGKAGDPVLGDFDGAHLVKRVRTFGTYDEEAETAWENALSCYQDEGFEDPFDWMIKTYGKERAEELYWTSYAYHFVRSSWECRDCIILDGDEYFEKLDQRSREENKERART
jgi:hypothetical protein